MRQAGDRGSFDELMRISQVYATFAGEVWTDGVNAYWFRSTFVPQRPLLFAML
ncbi:MAG TPA: hypothetical protein VGB18_00010 [Candidatus Thermoplasmatota archaeon]